MKVATLVVTRTARNTAAAKDCTKYTDKGNSTENSNHNANSSSNTEVSYKHAKKLIQTAYKDTTSLTAMDFNIIKMPTGR